MIGPHCRVMVPPGAAVDGLPIDAGDGVTVVTATNWWELGSVSLMRTDENTTELGRSALTTYRWVKLGPVAVSSSTPS